MAMALRLASPTPSPLSSSQQMIQHPHQQTHQQHIHLLTTEKTPVAYHTKWTDIHPDSRQLLLHIEEKILEYRYESRRLDQCQRLYDTSALNEGFEIDAARISQELAGISTALNREKVSLQELMKVAKEVMRNAEVAVRSFMMLRSRFLRSSVPALATSAPAANITVSGSNPPSTGVSQATYPAIHIIDFYSGIPSKPSSFLQQTVARFEHQLQEYRQWIEDLERIFFSDSMKDNGNVSSDMSLLQSLPTVMINVHEFFIYVAAEVESLHQQILSMCMAYLADQRRRGDDNNPFLEADRRELAKQEAAARRVHPTLHMSAAAQSTTQAAGLFASSPAPSSAFSSTPAAQSLTSTLSIPQSSSTQSLFGSSLSFSSLASSSSTPGTSLFGTSSLFGSSGSAATPSIIGSGTSSPIFGSAPAVGSSASTFSPIAFAGGSTAASSSSGGLLGVASMTSGVVPSSSSMGSGGLFGAQTSGGLFGTPAPSFGAGNIANAGASLFGMGTTAGTSTAKPKSRTSRRK